ncbi:MAG: S8 family serine peptidase [bacterium]
MKKSIIIFLIFLISQLAFPQTSVRTDSVIKLNPVRQAGDFVPGVILVKFKDAVPARAAQINGLGKVGIASLDALFQKYQVKKAEKLFLTAEPLKEKKLLKTFTGQTFEQPSLHNIYKLEIIDRTKLFDAIEELKKDQNVEYAEPNYIFSIVEDKPVSNILTEDDVKRISSHSAIVNPKSPIENLKSAIPNRQSPPIYPPSLWRKADAPLAQTIPNDPLYSQQWYIPAIKADSAWSLTTGDTTQIIAILDTGVDWLHPDLKNKIWINQSEANGMAGVDDDHNGLIDDIHGWDYINNDNNPTDDNSHGTHVAGIAAAEANNGIGIAGVNWKAKTLPIKVFQSSGRGDAATITQGIIYAASKGVTVINMSFGSYARSSTMEAALQNAYATSVLVAAAGNDGIKIGPGPYSAPFYPAALSYVLGVQATQQTINQMSRGKQGTFLSDFTNYDQDGPVYSGYSDLLNYEIKATGSDIISTVPNGGYRVYSGTSMSTPIVSGVLALYQQLFPGQAQELMWGNLINTSSNNINLLDAMNIHANPVLWFVSNKIVDTLAGDNNNGLVDAGETVQLWFTVRNTWGQSDSVFVGLRLGEFEDTSVAQILNPTVFIGSISPYAKRTNEFNPLRLKINTNLPHNREISLIAKLWNSGSSDTITQNIIIKVTNARTISGYIPGTVIIDSSYINVVPSNLVCDTLILNPGSMLRIQDGVSITVIKKLYSVGSPTSHVFITNNGYGLWRIIACLGEAYFAYTTFEYGSGYNYDGSSLITGQAIIENCLFQYNEGVLAKYSWVSFNKNVFTNNSAHYFLFGIQAPLTNNVIVRNVYSVSAASIGDINFISGNAIYNNPGMNAQISISNSSGFSVVELPPNYLGTSRPDLKDKILIDYFDETSFKYIFDKKNILNTPPENIHGLVWRVLIDGIDPQDSTLDPIGVGAHRFDVFFNRAMDTSYTPQLSFGVREPYTQQAVADSGRWSSDGKVWTSYKTVKLYTGDGINRVRVAGAKDPERFEIPIEDQRFEFLIDAAGTSSTEFTANPGLGKIKLEWNNAGVTDLLGFNMYRFTNLTDTTFTEPQLLNTQLITDTLYTDFSVTPGTRYYYKYKIVRTDFSESDYSRVTNAIALTAAPGDANGDLSTNVLDIISIVSKILNQNPQPFIFEAADINHDNVINVLDIVGTINIILHGGGGTTSIASSMSEEQAIIRLERGQVSLESAVPVGGIQLTLTGIESEEVLTRLKAIECFEFVTGRTGKDTLIVMMYSLSGNVIALGNQPILKIDDKDAKIISAVIATSFGESMKVKVYNNGESLIPDSYMLQQNYPNPFNLSTRLQYGIPEKTRVKIIIYNILGQRVKTFELGEQAPGRYEVLWDGTNEKGSVISSGIYFYRFESERFTQTKKLLLIK